MNRAFTIVMKHSTRASVLGAVAVLVAGLSAQAQQAGSLADAARQARAQKQTQTQSQGDNNRAQAVANELSEDQNDTGAPGGFKTYNAGDYKLWVPAPYRLDGHDDAGVVISGPQIGSKHAIVMIGTPIVSRFENNDDAFQEVATKFAHLYAQSASCSTTTIAAHDAYKCGLAAANLVGQRVSGNAVFVRGTGSIYPVFCVAPSESFSRDYINNNRVANSMKAEARENLAREEDDARKVYQTCETVFQSIHIVGKDAAQKGTSSAAGSKPAAPQTDSGKVQAPAANESGPANLATVARNVHEEQAPPAPTAVRPSSLQPQSGIPAGLKVQAFNYCQSATQCWDASVLVPADAKLVSSDCKQYIFETKVQGATFLLMAGVGNDACGGRNASDPNLVHWKQLVDPDNKRAPGTFNTISSQEAKLDGKPALITTLGFRTGMTEWMARRVDVESNKSQIVVGCIAPRDHFADGDSVCSALIASLRLP